MNDSKDLEFPAGRSARGRAEGWPLPVAARRILGRAAPSNLPILLARASEDWFLRLANAIHAGSGRDHLICFDLRNDTKIRLPARRHAQRSTIALDGLEMLDLRSQENLLDDLEILSPRLISGTVLRVAELRPHILPELLGLLATIDLELPSLATAPEMAGSLAEERLQTLATDLGVTAPELSAEARAALAAYAWPGEDAELDGVLSRTLLACEPGAPITADTLVWPTDLADEARESPNRPQASDRTAEPGAPTQTGPDAPTPPEPPPTQDNDLQANGKGGAPQTDVESLAIELAHKLKNPLVTLKTFVGNAASLGEDPEKMDRFRALAEESIGRMDATLDELLDFARLGDEESRSVDVLGCLRASLRDVWQNLEAKQVALEGPEGQALRADLGPGHLTFAFRTLAHYLEDAVEARGTLSIALSASNQLELRFPEAESHRHLREAARNSAESFPLSLLLVRGALTHVGGTFAVERTNEELRLILGFPVS